MSKKLFLTSLCGLAASGVIQADITDSDLYLFLGGTSNVTSVSTSMHDAGSAAASYTLGSGGRKSNAQTTSGGNSSAYVKNDSPSSAGSTTSTGSASGYSSSDSVNGGLGAAGLISTEADDPSNLIITVESGYQSQYVYNGLNRMRFTVYDESKDDSFSKDDFDSYYLGANVMWKGLSAGLKYIRSLDSNFNPRFVPSEEYESEYSEYVVDLNYTLGLVAGPQGSGNWLDATVGYEFSYYPEDTFWNTDSQHKFYVMLKMNRYKWLRPSVAYHLIEAGSINKADDFEGGDTYLPGFDSLSGEQLIFQVDGGDVVYSTSNVEIGVVYYAKAGFASGYNTSYRFPASTFEGLDNAELIEIEAELNNENDDVFNSDWYQVGINVPISFNNTTVTPSVHYTGNDGKVLKDPGFWWGINAKYTF
jgi:hypothetical protein